MATSARLNRQSSTALQVLSPCFVHALCMHALQGPGPPAQPESNFPPMQQADAIRYQSMFQQMDNDRDGFVQASLLLFDQMHACMLTEAVWLAAVLQMNQPLHCRQLRKCEQFVTCKCRRIVIHLIASPLFAWDFCIDATA